jgi:hypothetical protein
MRTLIASIRCKPFAVQVLEDFVEAIFASALERVADESWGPAKEDAAQTFFRVDHFPGLRVGLVEGRIDLAATFYLVESLLATAKLESGFLASS